MSQYPYGYPSQGQPPQQQYPPYQPYNTYPTPNGYASQPPQQYPQQQPQPSTTGNYFVASQSAYNHNASSIPGLGIPSAAPAFAVPFNEPWNQGYATSATPVQYSSYNVPSSTSPAVATSSNHQSQTFDPPGLAPTAGNTWSLSQAKNRELPRNTNNSEQPRREPKAASPEEEGEVSEPDFDDLYDDVSNQVSNQATVVPLPSATTAKSAEDFAVNNSDQEADFYDTEVEERAIAKLDASSTAEGVAPQQTHETLDQVERDRSGSYSPYLSPREIEQDIAGTSNGPIAEAQATSKASSATVDRAKNPNSSFDTNGTTKKDQALRVDQGKPSAESPVEATGPRVYANVPEAQNEAKKAILKLLPHGVKYQTYIDEGFDATLVKELFSQLNLPTDPAVAVPSEKSTASQKKENSKPLNEALPVSQIDSMAKKQEERKDKIARLIAEKKAKAAVAASSPGPTAESKSANNISSKASTPTKPSKTRAEMDRLLQQKMQALRDKTAQKPSISQTHKPIVGDKPSTPTVVATSDSSPRPNSTAGTPVSLKVGATLVQGTATQPSGTPRDSPSIPTSVRLPLPSAPKATQMVNQRKRPVAADFMDYPPSSIKRPSLANRQNSSLVISISEDEDDDDEDDDVEMEVDSAEDSPAPASSITLPRRGPLIRDYPPLTNRNSPRHLPSPASGASPVGGRTANVDLQAREQQIVELKRKIQEAEARAKNKPKKGSATPQTPSAGNITPTEQPANLPTRRMLSSSDIDDKGDPSTQLLQEAEAATHRQASEHPIPQRAESEHHSRVSSVQLPGKSDKVREKAERLRKMQEEMMKLQAEINEDMAQEEDPGNDIRTSNDDIGIFASSSIPQSAEVSKGLDASNPSGDATTEVSDPVQQSDDAFPASPAEVEAPDDQEENMDMSSGASDEDSTPPSPILSPEAASQSPQSTQQEHINFDADDLPTVAADLTFPHDKKANDTNASDEYEPPEAQLDDHAAEGSPPFSPAPADRTDSNTSKQRQTNAELQRRLAELRNQLVSAKASKEQVALSQPHSVEETNREVHRVSSTLFDSLLTRSKASDNASVMPATSFVPYDSPLRYFRAYRFHPRYSDDVAGGLKSLTYSNRIDPKREMCPDELDGTECPRGDACQFQHFNSIVAPDNEIILDLGSSDDLIGDQKKNFNNGLRELVATFQQSKVRDFRTIAQAIVEFRRRFLGDNSKVLRLEGVNI